MAINFPNTPSNGDTHAVGEMIFTYDAAKNSWTPLSAASGASVIVSDTPPSSPSSGDLWTDSTTMKMFIYYEDADSSQWVEVSGSSGGGSGASGSTGGGSGVTMETTDPLITNNGTLGELWLNTTSGELYACTDITTDDNIWTNIGDGTGNITSNVPPGNPTNTTIADKSNGSSFNHTFTGGTDTDGNVTHYIVDEITGTASGNVVANPMTVALDEVPVDVPHQFTIPTLTEDTTISFRVRSKDNSGSYSSGVTISFTVMIMLPIVASGGIENTYSIGGVNYKSHTFLTSGNFIVTDKGNVSTVDILVVAGGGGGSRNNYVGGGGGGGAAEISIDYSITEGTYISTVGGGGASWTGGYGVNAGVDSIFSTFAMATISGAIGGNNPLHGNSVSCNTSGNGNDCGTGGAGGYFGAGGGGAGAAGIDGAGGSGIESLFRSGTSAFYGGGGGGGVSGYPDRLGGIGGGGNSTQNGEDNTGGGGGGGSHQAGTSSGAGGSGIIIIRYAI
jgi:hypothetical protein